MPYETEVQKAVKEEEANKDDKIIDSQAAEKRAKSKENREAVDLAEEYLQFSTIYKKLRRRLMNAIKNYALKKGLIAKKTDPINERMVVEYMKETQRNSSLKKVLGANLPVPEKKSQKKS